VHHVSAHDVHELYEIAKSIKQLLTKEDERAQSITQLLNMQGTTELKRFLKRLVIILISYCVTIDMIVLQLH
jgi:hypothetical protein